MIECTTPYNEAFAADSARLTRSPLSQSFGSYARPVHFDARSLGVVAVGTTYPGAFSSSELLHG